MSTPERPSGAWQPRIQTEREAAALESLRAYLGAANDAEALRHGLRLFCKLIEMDQTHELCLATDDGSEEGPAIGHEPFGEADRAAEKQLGLRRWTVKADEVDRDRCATVRAWLDGEPSWRVVWSTTIVRMGELCARLSDERTLWGEYREEGNVFSMVLV